MNSLRELDTLGSYEPFPMLERLKPMDIHALLALDIPERQMILEPVMPEKGLGMLYAGRGTGKTFVACGMSHAAATGTKFLKWQAPKPRKVLHCDGEMAAVDLRQRFAQIMEGATVKPAVGMLNILTADLIELGIGNLASPKVQSELDPWLEDVELLVLDNLSSLTAVIRDNDAESWNPIQEWLLRLRRRGVSVLIVHHAGKGGEQRGTSRREDVRDTSISLRRPSDYVPTEGARFEVHSEKARGIHGERAKPFEARLEIRDGAMLWTIREIEDVNLARVKALLDDDMSIRDIANETGLSKSTVHRLKKQIDGGGESDMGQSPLSVSHGNGSANCPKPFHPSGTPESLRNQGFSAAVPLSQPLAGRDMGHLTVGDGDPFASLKDEALLPDLAAVGAGMRLSAYEARWPIGTRQRVWLDVLLYTGLRRGDALRLGRQHVRDGVATIKTEKGQGKIEVSWPILPILAVTLAAGPCGDLFYICGARGEPLTKESFGNLFKDACKIACVPGSAHGVRKIAATRAANAGATEAELMAIFGWTDPKMAAHYTRTANRKRLAAQAMEKLNAERTSIPAPWYPVRAKGGT